MHVRTVLSAVVVACVSLAVAQPPTGGPSKLEKDEEAAAAAIKGAVKGQIVWSTSRSNPMHDIWIMNADGSDQKPLTKGDGVDWYPRFSPDGKTVLFCRSKIGWAPETDAEYADKWDLWTIGVDGSDEKKVCENATWGVYRPDGKTILFARGGKVFTKNLESGEEALVIDGEVAFKKGLVFQQPEMSDNGKYLAGTLRGSVRETGIWNIEKKTWCKTGGGCQIEFFPGRDDEIYRMNPTGNGGTAAPSEVLVQKLKDGCPVDNINDNKKLGLMDLPGRRSHEYFPKFDQNGEWMVWCATAAGHDHDLYDYEVYIWKRGQPVKSAARLTVHTGNDRWPDVYIQK